MTLIKECSVWSIRFSPSELASCCSLYDWQFISAVTIILNTVIKKSANPEQTMLWCLTRVCLIFHAAGYNPGFLTDLPYKTDYNY